MRKRLLIGIASLAAAGSALAQGTVIFENATATGSITIGPNLGPSSYAPLGSYTVALLWAAGNTAVPQSNLSQIALYVSANDHSGAAHAGFFTDTQVITTGVATLPGTVAVFEVQGWLGNYTSYAQAVAAGAYVGQTAEFLNHTGNPNPPATPPVQTTGWDGNLVLVPEPGTLALCGLGVAGVLFFRRSNQKQNKTAGI